MNKIFSTKKLDFNFFRHNLHTVREGIIKIFGKIKTIWVIIFVCFSPGIYQSFYQLSLIQVSMPVSHV